MKERLDKSFFKKQSLEDADNTVSYWKTKSLSERLQAGYFLSLRAYGYDPANPPKLDKKVFSIRKRD